MNFIKYLLIFLSLPLLAKIPTITAPSEKSFYIIDGDSLSLQMRIYGIDTPEKGQKCQKIKGKQIDCGLKAKIALTQLLKRSRGKITLKPITFDHYKRMLVRVFYRDKDIGKKLVRSGMAFAFNKDYKNDERLAKKEKLGFWGYYKPPQNPKKWRKTHKRKFKKRY